MRKVKVLTAFLAALTAAGLMLKAPTIHSVTVGIETAVYDEEMTVTTTASIETTAATTTTTTTVETTTTTEETTTSEETTTTEETTSTEESTTTTTTPAPVVTEAPAPPQTEAPAPAETEAPAETAAPAETEAAADEAQADTTAETAAAVPAVAETAAPSNAMTVSWSDYVLLCNVVAHEYGSDWVPIYDKALVVEVVMNRVNSSAFPNDIYSVLTQRYQFSGAYSYVNLGTFSYQVTDSVKAAVDLYLSDPSQFNHGYLSFSGDGRRNYFR